jgi:hypothetical protein
MSAAVAGGAATATFAADMTATNESKIRSGKVLTFRLRARSAADPAFCFSGGQDNNCSTLLPVLR